MLWGNHDDELRRIVATMGVPKRARARSPRRVEWSSETYRQATNHHASKHAKGLISKAKRLAAFYELNRDIAEAERWTAVTTVYEWAAQAADTERDGKPYAPTTIRGWVKDVKKHRIEPRDLPGTLALLNEYVQGNGINRMADQHAPSNLRELRPINELIRCCLIPPPARNDAALWLDRQVAWYVCTATGCRPKHLWGVLDAYIDEEAIYVQWGRRKQRPACRTALKYRYCWSAAPPKHVRDRLERRGLMNLLGSCTDDEDGQSGPLLRWLQRAAEDATMMTGHARTRMSHILRALVKAGRLTELEFEELLDHQVLTSFRHYRVSTE